MTRERTPAQRWAQERYAVIGSLSSSIGLLRQMQRCKSVLPDTARYMSNAIEYLEDILYIYKDEKLRSKAHFLKEEKK